MKKSIAALGISAVAFTMALADADAAENATVTAEALNMRSGAGITFDKTGTVYKGESVSIIERQNGWVKISTSSGKTGWVSEQYLSTSQAEVSQTSLASEKSTSGSIAYVSVASSLNVRSTDSISGSIIAKISNNTKVQVINVKDNGWTNIKLANGQTGWVSSTYLKKTINNNASSSSGETPGSSSESAVSVSGQAKVTASSLNIRKGPGTNYAVIKSVAKNTMVSLQKKSGSWYSIKLSDGTTGWASSQYLSLSSGTGSSSGTDSNSTNTGSSTSVSGKLKVTASTGLNVRKGPGRNYSVVSSVAGGSIVDAVEKSGSWYKIKLSNGTTGWVSGQYVTSYSGESSSSGGNSSSTSVSGRLKVNTTSGLNVRKGPGTEYAVVASLSGGSVVESLEKSGSWYKVKLLNGTTGWVSGQYVSSTNESVSEGGTVSGNTSGSMGSGVSSSKGEAVVDYAYTLLGTPYQWGGNGPDKFDCSGYTKWVYSKAAGVSIPRVSRDQATAGKAVAKGDYQKGDLLYFDTSGNGSVSHVGIYVGGDKFIHCSGTQTKPGSVKVSSLTGYYGNALLGARRIV